MLGASLSPAQRMVHLIILQKTMTGCYLLATITNGLVLRSTILDKYIFLNLEQVLHVDLILRTKGNRHQDELPATLRAYGGVRIHDTCSH